MLKIHSRCDTDSLRRVCSPPGLARLLLPAILIKIPINGRALPRRCVHPPACCAQRAVKPRDLYRAAAPPAPPVAPVLPRRHSRACYAPMPRAGLRQGWDRREESQHGWVRTGCAARCQRYARFAVGTLIAAREYHIFEMCAADQKCNEQFVFGSKQEMRRRR